MAFLRTLALSFPLTAVTALVAPGTAWAAGEACLRDTECVGAELCLGQVCTAASVPACATESDCTDRDAACVDGSCKVEGVTCQNPAGACWVRDGGGHCECGNGDGAGWSDGFDPDDPPEPPTDTDLLATCESSVVEVCGTEPPALPDSCVGEVLEDCQALIDREDESFAACGEDVSGVDIARVGRCCEDYADEFFAAYRECVLALEIDGCSDALAECEGEGGQGGEPASGQDAPEGQDDSANADDTVDRGCAIASERGAPGWLAALAMLVAVGATRRRTSARTR